MAALRNALSKTDAAFGALAAQVGHEHWHTRQAGASWSAGQTLTHMLLIHEFVPELVAKVRRGQGAFNYFPWLVDQLNVLTAHWAGYRTDSVRVTARHQRATAATLDVIETLDPADWRRAARFFSRGDYTVERLVRLPVSHFAEHAPAIERLLSGLLVG